MTNKNQSDEIKKELSSRLNELINNNMPRVANFINEYMPVLELLIKGDKASIVKIIDALEQTAIDRGNQEDIDSIKMFKNTFLNISGNYQGELYSLLDSLLDFHSDISKHVIRSEKVKIAKCRNRQEKEWILNKLNEVLKSANFNGCEYRGKFSKNKFVEKYTPLVNSEYKKRITDKTIRSWINEYLKSNKL